MGTNYVDNLSEAVKKGLLSERASGIRSCAAWSGELLMPPRVAYFCSLMP